ncbi:hypothetical protein LCGC14_1048730 [marine sediment metagenome]|uniref:DUF35 domain-containing protein n=1 Tax=marine sediment metagenome TaxID=412755 RepID=A0A0F9QVJ3_9ZZZZ
MSHKEELDWRKCSACGLLQHKSHLRCLRCKHNRFNIISPTGTCKLVTYTILKAPPAEFRDKSSYALGIVEFSNGIKAIGQISTETNLVTGMELKPFYTKICNNLDGKEVYAYVFQPN